MLANGTTEVVPFPVRFGGEDLGIRSRTKGTHEHAPVSTRPTTRQTARLLSAGRGSHRLGRFLFALGLLLVLFAFAADLNSTLERGAVFHADAHSGNVSVHRAFGADIDAIATLDVAIHLAHHDN